MKKLFLFLSLAAAVSMAGCDGYCHLYYLVNNQTKYDIVVDIENNRGQQVSISIPPHEERMVYSLGRMCAPNVEQGDIYAGSPEQKLLRATMKIGEETVPDAVWARKYCNFTNKGYDGTYTLTVTDELLELLLYENNSYQNK